MGIAHVSMDDGMPVAFGNADIDYLVGGEPPGPSNLSRPMHNLSERDVRLRDKADEIVDAHNAAFEGTSFLVPGSDPGHAAPRTTLEEMVSIEHNADGTHKGGSPHGPVVIYPVGSTELTIANLGGEQRLTIHVGAVAGTVCAGNDTRLHTSNPTLPANADHDGRYYSEAEIDAVERGFVSVGTGGTYATVTAAYAAGARYMRLVSDVAEPGAISFAERVVVIGKKKTAGVFYKWTATSITFAAGSECSILANLQIGNGAGNSNIVVIVEAVRLENLDIHVDGTAIADKVAIQPLALNCYLRNIREISAGVVVQTFVRVESSGCRLENIEGACSGIDPTKYHVVVGGRQNLVRNVVVTAHTGLYVYGNDHDIRVISATMGSKMVAIRVAGTAYAIDFADIETTIADSVAPSTAAALVLDSGATDISVENIRVDCIAGPERKAIVFSGDVERVDIANVFVDGATHVVSLEGGHTHLVKNCSLRRVRADGSLFLWANYYGNNAPNVDGFTFEDCHTESDATIRWNDSSAPVTGYCRKIRILRCDLIHLNFQYLYELTNFTAEDCVFSSVAGFDIAGRSITFRNCRQSSVDNYLATIIAGYGVIRDLSFIDCGHEDGPLVSLTCTNEISDFGIHGCSSRRTTSALGDLIKLTVVAAGRFVRGRITGCSFYVNAVVTLLNQAGGAPGVDYLGILVRSNVYKVAGGGVFASAAYDVGSIAPGSEDNITY